MPSALFLRLLASEDKGADLASALAAVRQCQDDTRVFEVNPESFRQIPGASFAYWVSERVRRLFKELPPFEGDGRTVRVGLQTGDDFRFVRAWWEVAPERILDAQHGPDWEDDLPAFQAWCRQRTHEGKRWVPFAKGGEYSPYYANIHLVVNWEWEGKEIKAFVDPETGKTHSRPQNTDFYFRPGLTWPRRPAGRGAFSSLPPGAIFSDSAPTLFLPRAQHWAVCAILNSNGFTGLLHLLMPRGVEASAQTLKYEAGYVTSVPLPVLNDSTMRDLDVVGQNFGRARLVQLVCIEPNLMFVLDPGLTSSDSLGVWEPQATGMDQRSQESWDEQLSDDLVFAGYGIDSEDRQAIEAVLRKSGNQHADLHKSELVERGLSSFGVMPRTEGGCDCGDLQEASSLISYLLGGVFGRWDVRLAIGERPLPDLPDPFNPLPVCSPGMLQGDDGLPLRSTPEGYPIPIDWDGIVVDEPGHPDDLIARLRQVLEVIYQENAGAIEAEITELLGVKDLRDYFRRPTKGGFWLDHVARYSKSRRKAPIYWLLQSRGRSYALWLYYHRLDRDLLYKAVVNYVEPKLRLEESRLKEIEEARILAGPTGREAKQLAQETEAQQELVQEITEFAQALSRAAELHLIPDLDDGVLLNIAPLWELVPWKETATTWQELLKGKYPWSSVGQQLKERGVVKS